MFLFLILAFLTGCVVPIQTASNARMRLKVDSALVATLIAFSVSSVFLCIVAGIMEVPVLPGIEQISVIPWWNWIGGVIALFAISSTILLFRSIGQLQTSILTLSGQLSFSMVIDHFGLFGSAIIPMSAMRLLAMLILITGVLLVVLVPNLGRGKTATTAVGAHVFLWQLLAFITGCTMASIGAIYGALAKNLGSAMQASALSFIIATIVMAIVCSLSGKLTRVRRAFTPEGPWWIWLGGLCGAAAVFSNAKLIPILGAGIFIMSLLLGQMSLSLFMEKYGWLGAPQKQISYIQILGIALMVIGVAIVSAGCRR